MMLIPEIRSRHLTVVSVGHSVGPSSSSSSATIAKSVVLEAIGAHRAIKAVVAVVEAAVHHASTMSGGSSMVITSTAVAIVHGRVVISIGVETIVAPSSPTAERIIASSVSAAATIGGSGSTSEHVGRGSPAVVEGSVELITVRAGLSSVTAEAVVLLLLMLLVVVVEAVVRGHRGSATRGAERIRRGDRRGHTSATASIPETVAGAFKKN